MLPYVKYTESHHIRKRSLVHFVQTVSCLTTLLTASCFPSSTRAEQLEGYADFNNVHRSTGDTSPFGWKPCPHSQDDRWRCGSIKVPYDYHNSSDTRTMQIETVLFQAGKTRSNHTIVINPGGPGASGVAFAWNAAQLISNWYTDNNFDVLGFDPRGVNASVPHVFCYPSYFMSDRWASLGSYYHEKGDKMADLQLRDSLFEARFRGCREKYGDLPSYMSTASVARDIETIRAALNEDKLYYYGASYGTALGLTYSQLFPDRVGRMIFDGVEDIVKDRTPEGWAEAALVDTMRAYQDGFITECIQAGPDACALARGSGVGNNTDSPQALRKRLDDLFAALIEQPMPGTNAVVGPGVVRFQNLNDVFGMGLYKPKKWPGAASMVNDLLNGNATQMLDFISTFRFQADPNQCPVVTDKADGDAFNIVVCADAYDAPQLDLDQWLVLWKNMTDTAYIGGDGNYMNGLPCRHFDWKPIEVYRGNLDANLSNPVLLVSETYDPATPLASGLQVYKYMSPFNARMVIHHGYGHTSSANPSNCTEAIKKDYMLNGVLPSGDQPTDCYANEKPYVGGMKPTVAFERPDFDLDVLVPTKHRVSGWR